MDTRYCFTADNTTCNESSIRQSLFNKRPSSNSSSSISTLSVSISDRTVAPQFSVFYNVNEIDRLISDQGLITPKERSNTPRRRIRDKSYYKGLIHLKGREIKDEIKKLNKEISSLRIDQSTYLPYKKKAELKATDLHNYHKTLATYNLLDDMFNRDVQLDEAKEELQNLKTENVNENAEVEKIFDWIKQQETVIKEMETDLSQENYVSEILTTTTNPQLRENYKKLKRTDDEIQSARSIQEEELRSLTKEKEKLESQCSQNMHMKKGLELIRKLLLLENQRDELFSEVVFNSQSDEWEHLQKHKIECTDLLKGMTQEIRNLESKIKSATNELKTVEHETLSVYSERSVKYSKLKKKETIIDEFLSSYSNHQFAALTKEKELECKVNNLLKDISNTIACLNPNLHDDKYKSSLKDEDAENIIKLKLEYLKLTTELEDMENMERKLYEEEKLIKDEIVAKEKEIPVLSNIEDVKENLKKRENELTKELEQINWDKHAWKLILDDLKYRYDTLHDKLHNDYTYIMLSKLEKRWHSLEEENFAITNFTEYKSFGKNYLQVKDEVRKLYLELNNML